MYNEDLVFTRCVVCNALIEDISLEEAQTMPDFVFKSQQALPEKFTCCRACPKLYWVGNRATLASKDVEDMIKSIEHEALIPGRVPHEFSHRLSLDSAYSNYQHGTEPSYTNFTSSFQGCLDYIFFSRNKLDRN